MKELGPDVPVHFTAFHPDHKMTDIPATPPATLTRARRIAMDEGLNYVYTGNVHDDAGGSTYCPGCKKPLIVRDWLPHRGLSGHRRRHVPPLRHGAAGALRNFPQAVRPPPPDSPSSESHRVTLT